MSKIVPLKRLFGYVVIACATTSLVACAPAPEGLAHLHDYQTRVANTLDRDPIVFTAPLHQQPPAERELRITVPRLEISLLDSMRLDACAAGPLIAQRNSTLGRLQNGVLRYYYDRQLSAALVRCAEQLSKTDPDLAQRVQQQAEAKNQILPLLRAQAITQDSAVRNIVSLADRPLATPDSATLAPLFGALKLVLQTLDNSAVLPEEEALITALERLEKDRYLGQLWRALADNTAYLQQLQPLVAQLSQDAGCDAAGVPNRAHVLRQVFISRFSGPVQRHIGALTNQAQQLESYLVALRTPQPRWQEHLNNLAQLDDQMKRVTRNHVEHWQQLFRDCGFTPGA